MDSMSIKYPRESFLEIPFSRSALYREFILNETCRGKPFLKLQERYICILPNLMTDVFWTFLIIFY